MPKEVLPFIDNGLSLRPIDRKLESEIKLRLREEDTVLAILGSTSIALGLVEEAKFFASDYQGNVSCDLMRMVLLLLSVMSCVAVVRRYKSLLSLQKVRQKVSNADTIYSSKLYRLMIVELLINAAHCPPGLNQTFKVQMLEFTMMYSVNTFVSFVLLLKLYLVVRLFSKYSKFMQARAEMIMRWYGQEASTTFAIRGYIFEHPLLSVGVIFASLSVLWSVIILLLEQPARNYDTIYARERGYDLVTESSLSDFSNCLWMIFVTTTTGKL